MGLIKMNGVNYWGSAYGQGIIAPMIYSEEEIEVGVWTDGKPLYQKTVHISALPDSSHIGQYVDYPHGIADIENIIDYEGRIYLSSGTVLKFVRLSFNINAFNPSASIDSCCTLTNIRIECGSDRSSASADYTIWYTKTTDVAGSGTYTPSKALAVHYSTNEQVIGTWINNKPLYEKVVAIPNTSVINSSFTYAHGISNLDMAIVKNAFMYHPATHTTFDMPVASNDTNTNLAVRVNDTNIFFTGTNSFSADITRTLYVILQYTKTTD